MPAELFTICPYCGKHNDLTSHIGTDTKRRDIGQGDEEVMPSDGDITMCISCGKWSVFDNGKLRHVTEAEAEMLARSPIVVAATVAWIRTQAGRN